MTTSSSSEDLPALFASSTDRFTALVSSVGDQWSAPTPCSDWNVRDLVNHVAGEHLWAPHLVAGSTIADVGDRYDGDVLGADPVAAWNAASSDGVASFQGADLDADVHLSFGDLPCREYLRQMLTDVEVHGWDLATAIGADATLDPAVVAAVLPTVIESEADLRASGLFGPAVDVGDGATDADRLLGLMGRRP